MGVRVPAQKYAAYLNLIEPWWKTLRSLALSGRDFESWREVEAAIAEARDYWNDRRHPYVWGRRRRHRAARSPGIGAMPTVPSASGRKRTELSRRTTGERYPAVVATAASFAAGLLFLLPAAVGEVLLFGPPELGTRGWLVLVYLGTVASALALFLWNHALRYVPASAAALYVNLVPVVGLGFALLFGEHVGAVQFVGGALTVLGVLLGDATARRRRGGASHRGPDAPVE